MSQEPYIRDRNQLQLNVNQAHALLLNSAIPNLEESGGEIVRKVDYSRSDTIVIPLDGTFKVRMPRSGSNPDDREEVILTAATVKERLFQLEDSGSGSESLLVMMHVVYFQCTVWSWAWFLDL